MALAENKRVRFDYEITEELEAGIELFGHEVKSIRNRRASIDGARVIVRGNEAYLIGMTVPPYQAKNIDESYEAGRNRRLLLNKHEIGQIAGAEGKKGLTIVPISVYNKGRKIKVSIGIVRGKKKFDKRETIKRRETDREIRRTLKRE